MGEQGVREGGSHGILVSRLAAAALAIAGLIAAGCATRPAPMVLELQGSVMYRKPAIAEITYATSDTRATGGAFVVTVRMMGDPGLAASFDVAPGVAERRPMVEETAGHYVGAFTFPKEILGGPYSVIGRLRHDKAGESAIRDPRPLSIPLVR